MAVAETDDEALAAGRTALADFNHSLLKPWHAHDDHSVDALSGQDFAVQAETMICEPPARAHAVEPAGGSDGL